MAKNSTAGLYSENEEILEHINEFRLFSEFPQELLDSIMSLGEVVEYKPGDAILSEGQVNKDLFFLLDGTVTVTLEDKIVSQLRRKGDLFGEMSIISAKPCAATVTADTEVKCLKIDGSHIHNEIDSASTKAQAALYRVYSLLLCDKLKITNQRARDYEHINQQLKDTQDAIQNINQSLEQRIDQSNRELKKTNRELETQNRILQSSFNKLSELNNLKQKTFEHLSKIDRDQLPDVLELLSQLEKGISADKLESVLKLKRALKDLESTLKPIVTENSPHANLSDKRILFAESVKKLQNLAKNALGGTGVNLDIASTEEEAKELLSQNTYDSFICSMEFVELMGDAKQTNADMRCVVMTAAPVPEYLPLFKQHPYIDNIIARSEDNRAFTIKNLITTVNKMANADIFGLDKYLSWGVEVTNHTVKSSKERKDLIESMSEHLRNMGLRKTLVGRCESVAEELLMNAVYDAPQTSDGKSKYNHLDRKETVNLESYEEAEFSYACDGMYVALGVSDPFGALSKKVIIEYLENNYLGTGGQFDDSKGGGGHGLHLMVESTDLLIFNVRKDTKTEVIALFQIGKTGSSDGNNPSFQFFYEEK